MRQLIIAKGFGGEAEHFGGEASPPHPPLDRTLHKEQYCSLLCLCTCVTSCDEILEIFGMDTSPYTFLLPARFSIKQEGLHEDEVRHYNTNSGHY